MKAIKRTQLGKVVLLLIVLLVMMYIFSYVVLSRIAFAEADELDIVGFYFLTPEDSDAWRFWNYTLVRFYYPLILVDNLLGTDREIAFEPLWGLE